MIDRSKYTEICKHTFVARPLLLPFRNMTLEMVK